MMCATSRVVEPGELMWPGQWMIAGVEMPPSYVRCLWLRSGVLLTVARPADRLPAVTVLAAVLCDVLRRRVKRPMRRVVREVEEKRLAVARCIADPFDRLRGVSVGRKESVARREIGRAHV